LVFGCKGFSTVPHDKFVIRKFLICIVPALENQIYLHPSLLDTQRKPLHTRSILIIVMFVMIMTIQHPGQCNNFLCCVFHRLQFVVSGCCGLVFFLHGSSSRLQHYKKLMIKNRGNWRGG